MEFKKLIVNEWFKTYEILKVNEECFNNSPNIEHCGSMIGFKIFDEDILNFKVDELINKGFKLEV